MDCENCHHLTVVGLRDTGPWNAYELEQTMIVVNCVFCVSGFCVSGLGV